VPSVADAADVADELDGCFYAAEITTVDEIAARAAV
jgi:hypothetical protein